jgi:hypothetical protein
VDVQAEEEEAEAEVEAEIVKEAVRREALES